MDAGVAALLLAVIALPVWFVWMVVRAARRAARKVEAAENAYLASLDLLRASPLDPNLREDTLALGRAYIEVRSRHGVRKGFSELALSNDINAACAHAVNHPGAVAKVAVVNAGSLSTDSVAKQIEDLNNLRLSGVLSDDEFERGKALFLGASPDKAAVAVSLLRNLDVLRIEGVLTQSEFNMKKWEILSERLLPGRLTAAR